MSNKQRRKCYGLINNLWQFAKMFKFVMEISYLFIKTFNGMYFFFKLLDNLLSFKVLLLKIQLFMKSFDWSMFHFLLCLWNFCCIIFKITMGRLIDCLFWIICEESITWNQYVVLHEKTDSECLIQTNFRHISGNN